MVAICHDCGDRMGKTKTCTHPYIQFGTEFFERNTTYFDANKRCHDCGITNKKGNIHHQGCDMERCPRCDGQLLACGCAYVSCDDTCGDWEENGCNELHAGTTHLLPDRGVITTYTKSRQKDIMKRRSTEMLGWMYEYEKNKVPQVGKN